MAFTSGSSWRWQMEMDHEDMTYELFWKQVLRWLVSSSPDPVMVTSDKDTYLPGEAVNLVAEVADKSFNRMNNARVIGKIDRSRRQHRNDSARLDGFAGRHLSGAAQRRRPREFISVEVEATQGDRIWARIGPRSRCKIARSSFTTQRWMRGSSSPSRTRPAARYYPLSDLGDIAGRRAVCGRRIVLHRTEGTVGRAVPVHAALRCLRRRVVLEKEERACMSNGNCELRFCGCDIVVGLLL